MGKQRSENLGDYYVKAAGVAVIWIDEAGHIGASDVATTCEDPGRITYCCLRGDHFRLGYHLYEWKRAVQVTPESIARKLEEMAAGLKIGLTKHVTAVERARAAVSAVEQSFENLSSTGGLREWNDAFKAARAVEPRLRYADFLMAKMAGMLAAIALRST